MAKMDSADLLRMSTGAMRGHPLRSALSMLGIAIGVASVILLTSLGEGARRFIVAQFSQFGTNVLAINPGRSETVGIPGAFGGTTQKLTIDDAEALTRLRLVEHVVPMAMGQARVEGGGRGRSVFVYGSTAALTEVLKFGVGQGSFLPPGDPRRGASVAVLGPTLKRELFGAKNALGEFVRIAGSRHRVIGVMTPKARCSAWTSTTPSTCRWPRPCGYSISMSCRRSMCSSPTSGRRRRWSKRFAPL